MINRKVFAILGVAGILAAPAAFADSIQDMDPYWKWSKIERTAASDDRAVAKGTGADAVANPGNYYY